MATKCTGITGLLRRQRKRDPKKRDPTKRDQKKTPVTKKTLIVKGITEAKSVEEQLSAGLGDQSVVLKDIMAKVDLKAALGLIKAGRWITKWTVNWYGAWVRRTACCVCVCETE